MGGETHADGELDGDWPRHARLLHELLRLLDVVLVRRERPAVPRGEVRDRALHLRPVPVEHVGQDGLDGDSVVHSLPHLHVVEGRLAAVHAEPVAGGVGNLEDLEPRLAFEALHVLGREPRAPHDHVDRLLLEKEHPVDLVGHEFEGDPLEVRLRPPVSLARLQDDLHAGLVLHEAIGTHAGDVALHPLSCPGVVLGGVRLDLVGVHDGVVREGDDIQRHRARRVHLDGEGVVVAHLELIGRAHLDQARDDEAHVAGRLEAPIEAVLGGVGGDGPPARKLCALADLEDERGPVPLRRPGLGDHRLPLGRLGAGESWLVLDRPDLPADERVVAVGDGHVAADGLEVRRVEGVDVGIPRDDEGALVLGLRPARGERGGAERGRSPGDLQE